MRNRLKDPDGFWRKEAARLDWMKPFTKVSDVSWEPDNLHIRWFEDGALNVAANCIDRHLAQARQPDRDHLGGRRSQGQQTGSATGSCTKKSAASPMC